MYPENGPNEGYYTIYGAYGYQTMVIFEFAMSTHR
jgi:hypothetical protein